MENRQNYPPIRKRRKLSSKKLNDKNKKTNEISTHFCNILSIRGEEQIITLSDRYKLLGCQIM